MLYGAELWPVTVAQKRNLEAAHYKFQRRMMGSLWKNNVSIERVSMQTQLEKIDLIIKETRLRWLHRSSTFCEWTTTDCQDKLYTGI